MHTSRRALGAIAVSILFTGCATAPGATVTPQP
jgi:hypothetical protein